MCLPMEIILRVWLGRKQAYSSEIVRWWWCYFSTRVTFSAVLYTVLAHWRINTVFISVLWQVCRCGYFECERPWHRPSWQPQHYKTGCFSFKHPLLRSYIMASQDYWYFQLSVYIYISQCMLHCYHNISSTLFYNNNNNNNNLLLTESTLSDAKNYYC
jgi:hypothetical protein